MRRVLNCCVELFVKVCALPVKELSIGLKLRVGALGTGVGTVRCPNQDKSAE